MKRTFVWSCVTALLLVGAGTPAAESEAKTAGKTAEETTAAEKPEIQGAVLKYKPEVVPGEHPRLWITEASLKTVRANLKQGENAAVWDDVLALSAKPYAVQGKPGAADPECCQLVKAKAFVYLMTGDRAKGAEAVKILTSRLVQMNGSFCKEASYTACLVYDWCYSLLTPADKTVLEKAIRKTDGLAAGIALYGTDNVPYLQAAYGILEKKDANGDPAKADVLSAWLLKRMAGKEVVQTDVTTPGHYGLYMMLPGGTRADPGASRRAFLAYTYGKDPVSRYAFELQGKEVPDKVLFLLLNDPSVQADKNVSRLPFGKIFTGKYPAVAARTGWDFSRNSQDVVALMKGCGDERDEAGSFRIFYRDLRAESGAGVPGGSPDAANAEILKNAAGNGVIGAYTGPGVQRPYFSYLWTDLTGALGGVFGNFRRAMCFVNLGRKDCPGAFFVVDYQLAGQKVPKCWALDTPVRPAETARGVEMATEQGCFRMEIFLPRKFTRSVAEQKGKGYRTVVADSASHDTEIFASAMVLGTSKDVLPEVVFRQNWNNIVFRVEDKIVVLPSEGRRQDVGFRLFVPEGRPCYTLIAGLQAGLWNVRNESQKTNLEATVQPEEGVIFVQLEPGEYLVTPGASADEVRYTAPELEVPDAKTTPAGSAK